jgi:hypothetical protein
MRKEKALSESEQRAATGEVNSRKRLLPDEKCDSQSADKQLVSAEKKRVALQKLNASRVFLTKMLSPLLIAFLEIVGAAFELHQVQAMQREWNPALVQAFQEECQLLWVVSAENRSSQAFLAKWNSTGIAGLNANSICKLLDACSRSFVCGGGADSVARQAIPQFCSFGDWREHVTKKFVSLLKFLLRVLHSILRGAQGGIMALVRHLSVNVAGQESSAALRTITAEIDANVPAARNGLGRRALPQDTVQLLRDLSRELSLLLPH